MGLNYLFDTNILIYHINNQLPQNIIDKIEILLDNSFTISAVTKLELLGWHKLTNEGIMAMNAFVDNAKVIDITAKIIDTAIYIKQSTKIKTADSIIAATAINNGLTLITRDRKDFHKVEGLEIYNPFD